ncbi:MAG: Lon-like protease helical domain-containing protein, partial [Thermodesulfobacteriota bacterium]
MRKVRELKPAQVYKTCDLRALKFKTTDDLKPCTEYIGQKRAVEAIHFGLGMDFGGYNLYLAGPTGVGKTTTIENILASVAKDKSTPPDWCYVFNFQVPSEPRAIELPTGRGKVLKTDMEDFLQDLKMDIPRAFESKEFEEQKEDTMNKFQRDKNVLFDDLQKKALASDIQVQFSPTGIITVPLIEGQAVTQENYNALDEETKEKIKDKKENVDNEVAEVLKEARKLEREATEKVKELEKKVALFSVRDLIDIIREKYKGFPDVIDYFDQLQKHILENIDHFLPAKGAPTGSPIAAPMPYRMPQQEPSFTEYKVNVFIETLCKYIDNLLCNPGEEKFRKIRCGNKAFQDRVASVIGGT